MCVNLWPYPDDMVTSLLGRSVHLAFLGLNAADWYALGQMLVGVAALGGSIWAVRLYRTSKRLEAAKWLDAIFRDFYVNESFADVRWLLARRTFIKEVVPILNRSIADPADLLDEEEARILHRVDRLLNFFEHILYMESEGHLPVKAREAFFGYWFGLMKSPQYRPLQAYIHVYGYEYLDRFVVPDRAKQLIEPGQLTAEEAAQPVADGHKQ
jgi:hypothetical protein